MTKSNPLANFPPYGYMADWQHSGGGARICPPRWDSNRTAEWKPWFDRVLHEISHNVWPLYTVGSGWAATAARSNGLAMTIADLEAIPEFQDLYYWKLAGGVSGIRHVDFLALEDEKDWHLAIARYCPQLAKSGIDLERVFYRAVMDYAGRYLPESFKLHFQRPRAYQMSMVLAKAGSSLFVHDTAKSADTPSLVSGHGLQGLIVGCHVYEVLRADKRLAARHRRGLQQWMTDIGDRRVMAGVHYPTDSLASWIVAAEIVDYLFPEDEIHKFLLEAIRESLLFKFLAPRVRKGNAYDLPWKSLGRALKK